ncbi:MarR family transcriptional regulator [Planomonospora sp. ID82291]|uniref:MarR family transcriptional regulator n=1 Tax=Planomonospora sp. ID82291 TaxID=2738136 RepID=UPI0018C3B9C3|nr:MarR family transcriptional regulator [Planomonospora sp. ID82291]MBG0815257.1 MarR family transcriptional regulator [Planomonospora sp. ID82291]
MDKPERLLARDREWDLLCDFLADPAPALRIAVVSGRRRHGKSFLLHALAEAADGLYLTAVREEGRAPALRRLSDEIAAYAGLQAGSLRFDDWWALLRNALQVVTRARPAGHPLLIIDELPYLMQHSPEVPGILQALYDETQFGEHPPVRLILCGSAMSIMHELLSGTKPLRGRAVIDLRLQAFDHRTARTHWGIESPEAALRVHAVLGGAPGYLPLAGRPAPVQAADFDTWVTRTVLDPGRAVFSRTEAEYLLREDPRITQHTLYYDLLSAIAHGACTPSRIGAALGRERGAVTYPLEVLESTGYVTREQDLLRARSPIITLTDPVIRFNQLITLPQASVIDQGFSAEAWRASAPAFNSKILGPHFEALAREWTRRHAHEILPDGLPGAVGTCELTDQAGRAKHEIDVLALALGQSTQRPRARIAVIGEAKATLDRRGGADLARLEHLRTVLSGQGHHTDRAVLALFSMNGFHPDLVTVAARRPDVLLVDLAALYGDGPPLGLGA